MGPLTKLAAAAKAAKKGPFFSKVDEVLESLPRNKGTGEEFLREIEKTKGVKPIEIKERGLDKALKATPKATKEEIRKVLQANPPPKVEEKVLTSDAPDYDEFLEQKAQEIYGVDWFDLRKDEQKALDKMFSDLPLTQYDKFKTPGGENYREILLKLPSFDDKRLMELEAQLRREEKAFNDPMQYQWFRDKVAEVQRLKEEKAAAGTPYVSSHYKTDPNLLAHIRVQDFTTPEGKKVLLVDEIQSDWHQEGRNLRSKEIKRIMDETGVDKKTASAQVPDDFGYKTQEQPRQAKTVIDKDGYWEVRDQNGEFVTNIMGYQYPDADQAKILEVANARIVADSPTQIRQSERVPEAPFKKNWHELAMKRVLNYAAENGYDTVAITPGAEQAKRYDLSKQLDKVLYSPYGDGTFEVSAVLPNGQEFGQVAGRKTLEEIEDTFGKEIAQKMAKGEKTAEESGVSVLSGEGLQVGGEGMKGFYDQILPTYLNNYGKPYGVSVGEIRLTVPPSDSMLTSGLPGAEDYIQGRTTWSELLADNPQAAEKFSMPFHSFDITPEMRGEISAKGLPMYGKIATPALEGLAGGTGAATIGSQMFDVNNEQQVQNPVHFTENPDAMQLEMMQRN